MPNSPEPPARRRRGRPRIHPLPDPNAPKRPRGRPRKDAPQAGALPKRPRGRPRKDAGVVRVSHAPESTASHTPHPPQQKRKPPSGRAVLGEGGVVPPRVTLARFHKYDALFRDHFTDPNPKRRFPTLVALSELFDISPRTVRRDIDTMSDRFGLRIIRFPERGGWGYSKLPPRLSCIWMEEGELLILAASWGALEGRRGSDMSPKVRKVMEKLMNVLGHDLSFDFKTVSERIAFRSSGYQSAIDVGVFETVVAAVLSQHELTFIYHKQTRALAGKEAAPAARLVQPRCMVCVDNSAWYIFADNPADPDEKPHTFALFRMSDVIDTGHKFEPTREFDLEETLRHSLGIDCSGPVETVELLFDPEVAGYIEEHSWHWTEKFGTAADGRLLLTMTVAINPELEAKIHRWDPNVEVLNPPELRETFKRHSAKAYARYH